MKTIKFLFAIALTTGLLFSCNKNDDESFGSESDYLIFGHFFGECQGEECVEIFKLEDGKLYEDSNDNYPGSTDFNEVDFSELSNELFLEVDGLEDVFPAGLLNETDVVLGQPDAGDWGGLYIEWSENGVKDFWLLDLHKDNVSQDYHAFIDAVTEKIQDIND